MKNHAQNISVSLSQNRFNQKVDLFVKTQKCGFRIKRVFNLPVCLCVLAHHRVTNDVWHIVPIHKK